MGLSDLRNLVPNIPVRKIAEAALDKVEDAAKKVVRTTEKLESAVADKAKDVFEDAVDKVRNDYGGRVVHGELEAVSTSRLKLKADFSDTARVEKLVASGAFTPVSLSKLPLDRSYVTSDLPSTGMKDQKPVGFTFDREDQLSHDWYPQAVTTSADADGKTGKVDGKSWVAVSWYAKNEPRSRISLVDYSDPSKPGQQKYRHVELMVPDATSGKLTPLKSHVGGVTWHGNYLYVAQTTGGVRVFDTRQLLKVNDPGQVPAGTEPYVLPQVGYYKVQAAPNGQTPVFSGLSMDRTGAKPALLSQEYNADDPGGRIIRWELDPRTGKLVEKNGSVQATDAWSVPMTRVSGVTRVKDGFRIATMGNPSNLFEAREGQRPERVDSLAQGVQQFSFDWTRNKIWTLAEHPGRRVVWAFEP